VDKEQHFNFLLHWLVHEYRVKFESVNKYPEEDLKTALKLVKSLIRGEIEEEKLVPIKAVNDRERCEAYDIFDTTKRCSYVKNESKSFCCVCISGMKKLSDLTYSVPCEGFDFEPRCFNKVSKVGEECDSCQNSVNKNLFQETKETEFWMTRENEKEIDLKTADAMFKFAERLIYNSIRVLDRTNAIGGYYGQTILVPEVRLDQHWKAGNLEGGKVFHLGYVKGRNVATLMENLLINFHSNRIKSPKNINKCCSAGGFTTLTDESKLKIALYMVTLDEWDGKLVEDHENVATVKNTSKKTKKLKLSHIGGALCLTQFMDKVIKSDDEESFKLFNLLYEN
jgi:hypothetical protein